MKTLKSLLYVLGATLLFAGCSDDENITVGAEDDPNCYGVYFPSQENIGDLELDPAATPEAKFIVRRNRDEDAITVPVTITGSEEGIFSATEIEFDEGQTETEFVVSFDGTEVGQTYTCEINIDNPLYASLYGERATGFSFSVTRVKWVLVKGPNGETKGKWRDEFLTEIMAGNIKETGTPYGEKDVEIYERADQPGYYRIQNIYDESYMARIIGVRYSNVPSVPTYTIIDATKDVKATDVAGTVSDKTSVWFPYQTTGWEINDIGYDDNGKFVFGSYCQENFPTASSSSYGEIKDGILSFPNDAIILSLPSIWAQGSYYVANTSTTRLIFPGYRAYDYTLALSAGETVDGKVNIAVRFGADVAKVKYAFYTGSTNDATVEVRGGEISAGEVASKELAEAGTIEASFETTGAYSVVAVAYNAAGEASGTAYANFGYVAAGEEEEQAVVMTVLTELTNEYAAQGITKENSIKVIMFGQDIQSGYYGLFQTASIAGMTEAQLLQALPSEGDPFTEEDLADINGSGWVDTFIKLSKGTSYTMLVMVNNGYYTKLYAVEQTTQGDPDPLDAHYTADDLIDFVPKEDLLGKTWDLYAVLPQDKQDPINRWYLGPVTFTENTTDDTNADDYITAKGLTTLASILEGGDDSWPILYGDGIIYPKAQHSFNKYRTYFVTNLWMWEEEPTRLHSIDYALMGAYVNDGLISFVGNGNYAKQGYTFNGVYFGAFTDAGYKDQVGYLEVLHYIVLADPAIYPTPSAAAATTNRVLRQPTNYVELRNLELAKAIRVENIGGLKARKANIKGESVSRPAAAQTTFKAGQFPQHSGDVATKIAAKNLVVKTK